MFKSRYKDETLEFNARHFKGWDFILILQELIYATVVISYISMSPDFLRDPLCKLANDF